MLYRILATILAVLILAGGIWVFATKNSAPTDDTSAQEETSSFVFEPAEVTQPHQTAQKDTPALPGSTSESAILNDQALSDQQETGEWLADFVTRLKNAALLSPETQARTDSLRRFGNEVALYIQSGPDNRTVAAALTALLNNENDENAAQKLAILAEDYSRLGEKLANMAVVPSEAKNEHRYFAEAYRELGMRLAAATASPPPRVDAFERYTESVQDYIEAALGMIDLFDTYNVVFGSGEPGSIFSIHI